MSKVLAVATGTTALNLALVSIRVEEIAEAKEAEVGSTQPER